MSPRRTALAAVALLATLGIGFGPAFAARDRSTKPPPVHVGAEGEYVRGAQGSYCYSYKGISEGEIVSACADAAYPLRVIARLPVIGRQRLTVDAGKRVKRLGGSLVKVEGQDVDFLGAVRTRRTRQGRFWKLRLPADLAGADALSLDISFKRNVGNSNVWAGLAVDGSASARIPSGRASKSTG